MLPIRLRQLKHIQGGINHFHKTALRPGLAQALPASRHPEHVPKGNHDISRLLSQCDKPVDIFGHCNADRAARAGNQPDPGGQQARYPVPVDLRRMGAADFHERQRPSPVALQIFKNFLHQPLPPILQKAP